METGRATPVSMYKYKESVAYGLGVESAFEKLLKQKGLLYETANKDEDYYEHWDYRAWIDGNWYRVDVKGMKMLDRSRDGQVQDTYVALELHGTGKDFRGWLYGGKADLIAFETKDSFVLAYPSGLKSIISWAVDKDERVGRSSEAIYKVYSRKGYEQVTWVEMDMIRSYACFAEWEKM